MSCDHRYVDLPKGSIGFVEVDGKGTMIELDSLSECGKCGDTRMSFRLEDGTMWIDLGDAS